MTVAPTETSNSADALAGLDFSLSEEQRHIRDLARDFAKKEIDPIVEEIDEAQRFPREVFAKLGELGLLGLTVPEEYGGSGMGNLALTIVLAICTSGAVVSTRSIPMRPT